MSATDSKGPRASNFRGNPQVESHTGASNDLNASGLRQKLGKKMKIGKGLSRKISERVSSTISSKISSKLGTPLTSKLKDSALTAAQTAAQTAKQGLDQVLLGLNHKGLMQFKDSEDLIQKVGRGVLDRAEYVRSQLANKPLSPSWLKEVSFAQSSVGTDRAHSDSMTGNGTDSASSDRHAEPAAMRDLMSHEISSEGVESTAEAAISKPASDMQHNVQLNTQLELETSVPRIESEAVLEAQATEETANVSEKARSKSRSGVGAGAKKKKALTHSRTPHSEK